MTWKDINLKQFLEMQKIYTETLTEFEKSERLISIIYQKDINQIPITEIEQYLSGIMELLASPMEKVDIRKEYILNGHKYKLKSKIEEMTTAQFWDFTELSKESSKNIHRLLSCFLIPDGKTYGTGYDMDEVLSDMDYLSIPDVNAISFFLLKRSERLQKTILAYSALEMMEGMTLREQWNMSKNLYRVCKSMDYLTMR